LSIRISESWKKVLEKEFQTDYFNNISLKTREEYSKFVCYPPGSKLFRAFDECPFNKLKVVIIGQDPYHGENQANGLCFSVDDGVEKPPSLKNIFKELNTSFTKNERTNSDLSDWSNQGVLLLNSILSVRRKFPGSHRHIGWEEFTENVIKIISKEKMNLVFMLWGNYAKNKEKFIHDNNHLVLKSGHPSPLSANKGFWFGNNHFKKCNDFLIANDLETIKWF
jgi:uracil-DNA glycosylase|tara:strand:+ start:285 stop:953 length:669 start_codon:yes stop_codon:yes gene_type:complete